MFEYWYGLFVIVGIGLFLIVVSELSAYFRECFLIKKGVLKSVKNTTEKDILRLKKEGYSVWAIKRYRQRNNVSLKEAKRAVGDL